MAARESSKSRQRKLQVISLVKTACAAQHREKKSEDDSVTLRSQSVNPVSNTICRLPPARSAQLAKNREVLTTDAKADRKTKQTKLRSVSLLRGERKEERGRTPSHGRLLPCFLRDGRIPLSPEETVLIENSHEAYVEGHPRAGVVRRGDNLFFVNRFESICAEANRGHYLNTKL